MNKRKTKMLVLKSNSVNSAVDLAQVILIASVSQVKKLANSCTTKYNLRLLFNLTSVQTKEHGYTSTNKQSRVKQEVTRNSPIYQL